MLVPPTLPDATTVRLAAGDLGRLSRLCLSCSGFYELVEGRPASDATAAETLGPLAPQYGACAKHVFAVAKGGDLIAVTELLQGHPSAREWYIGLLLVDPEHRRRGLGARLCAATIDWIGGHDGVIVRLVVQQQNPEAREFWERQSFHMEREMVKQSGRLENLVWILARHPKGAG